MDQHALKQSVIDLKHAIVDSIAIYEELLLNAVAEADVLRSLETEGLRDVVDSQTVLSSRAASIEERRQIAASRVAEIVGVDRDATLAEMLTALPELPDGVGNGLRRVARELSATVTELRRANDRNRSIAECGIYLTSNLISGLAPTYMPGPAYSEGGNSVRSGQAPIVEFTG